MSKRSVPTTDSMPFIRRTIRELAGYQPGEQPRERTFIKLNTNENPYPPSPKVLEAIRACATDDVRLYPDPMANALRDKAAAVYGLTREQVLAGNGSDDLLAIIIRACVEPGDRVVYPFATYSLYDTLVTIGGGRIVHIPFPADFSLPSGLAEAAGRVTFICNPNSPSGTAATLDEIADLSAQLQGLVVVDEAYVDFAKSSALPLLRDRTNVVILRTFSKSFSLAGLRIGLAFGAPEVIGELAKVKDSYNLTRVSISAAVAALDDYEWMQTQVQRVRDTRERLVAVLRELGFEVPPSQANFVLARRPGENLQALFSGLKERRILVRYFPTAELSDALRITVGTDDEIDALLGALRELF